MMWVYAISDTSKRGGGGRKSVTKAGGRKSGRKKPMTQKEREDALADFYGVNF